jgi:molecular chaperone DnaK
MSALGMWKVSETGHVPALGIDLGTTYSVVAQVNRAGVPTTLPNAEGSPITPSVVLFDRDQVVVGAVAREAVAADPEFVIQLVKRRMGSEWAFAYQGVTYQAEHISALILKKLVQDAQRLVGEVDQAVITVPAYFNDGMRAATRKAAEMAGISVLGLLAEPTAAAIGFGYEHQLKGAGGVVVDLGGGTFDVSVLHFHGTEIVVTGTGGDAYLGGANFDKVLFDHFIARFDQEHGVDVRDPDSLSVEDFTQVSTDWLLRADRAKHDLTVRDRTTVLLQAVGLSLRMEIARAEFERLSAVLLDELTEKMEDVVRTAGTEPANIDVVLAVGGATRMPMIQERIRAVFGVPPTSSVRPDEAVALGAAVYAARLQLEEGSALTVNTDASKSIEALDVTDVAAHSLGVSVFETGGRRQVKFLCERNTPLPCERSQIFYTMHPGERRIVVPILEGESPNPEECTRIGQVVIDGLPAGRPAKQPVTVTMAYDRDGILEVQARDEGSSTVVRTTIEREGSIDTSSSDRAAEAVIRADVH